MEQLTNDTTEIMNKVIKRPLILTVFCVFGVCGVIANLILNFDPNDYIGQTPLFIWNITSLCLTIITIIGVWKMIGWSILLFFMNNLISQNVLYYYKQAHPIYFFGFLVWLIILYTQRRKMIFKY